MFQRFLSSTRLMQAGKGAVCLAALSMLHCTNNEDQLTIGTKFNQAKVALCDGDESTTQEGKPLAKFNTKSTRLAVNEILVSN